MVMQKHEFLELFEAATRAAKLASKTDKKNSPEVSRCVDAMNRLKEAPESLACDVVITTTIGKSYRLFIDHKNPRIKDEAKLLWNLWLTYLYASGTTKQRGRGDGGTGRNQKRVEVLESTGDSKRDKVREILQTALSKVADEVVETEMKQRVMACDISSVVVSVESAMFEKLGCFAGALKAKYRSILFNMRDSNNPDLRRKVLIGEINGERLATMETEEMGSDKLRMTIQLIKEKARLREEERIKTMLKSDMIMT